MPCERMEPTADASDAWKLPQLGLFEEEDLRDLLAETEKEEEWLD